MKRWAAVFWIAFAAPLAAQQIPVPIADTAETRQISVTVTPGVTSMRQIPNQRLRILRDRMHDGADVPLDALRALADLGDGLAAQRYVRRLLTQGDAAPSDVAYYAAVAVGSGRVWTLPDMVAALHRLDPASEPQTRVRKYMSVLYAHAWAGNTLALQAVQDLNGAGRLFGPLSDATRDRMLAQSRENGAGRVELRMALAILERADASGTLTAQDRGAAQDLLRRAAASDSVAAATTADNLLRLIAARYGQN